MRSVTVADVMSWPPCVDYDESRVRELFGGRESLTALDILDLDVDAVDRLWAVLRGKLIDPRTLRRFAVVCAWRALVRERAAGREPDPRSWRAVEVARRYADGEATDEERAVATALAAAARAAWAASSAWAAAAAARAAWAAASAAARAAANAAEAAAAEAADAAYAAECEWQVATLRRLLRGEEVTP